MKRMLIAPSMVMMMALLAISGSKAQEPERLIKRNMSFTQIKALIESSPVLRERLERVRQSLTQEDKQRIKDRALKAAEDWKKTRNTVEEDGIIQMDRLSNCLHRADINSGIYFDGCMAGGTNQFICFLAAQEYLCLLENICFIDFNQIVVQCGSIN